MGRLGPRTLNVACVAFLLLVSLLPTSVDSFVLKTGHSTLKHTKSPQHFEVKGVSTDDDFLSRGSRRDFLTRSIAGLAGINTLSFLKPIPAYSSTGAIVSKCDPAISHLRDPVTGKEIFLIGTAHISNTSAILVQETVRGVRPDVVMVELDASRIARAKDNYGAKPPPAAANVTAAEAAAAAAGGGGGGGGEGGAPAPEGAYAAAVPKPQPQAMSLKERLLNKAAEQIGSSLSNMYKDLDKMGFQSGDEFKVAIIEGQNIGAKILLGDRNVKETLRRLTEALSVTDLRKVQDFKPPDEALFLKDAKMDDKESLSATVELLKQRQTVRVLMASLREAAPEVYNAMIRERDEYMAKMLRYCDGKRVVAVVGMGHMDGIESFLGYEQLNTCYESALQELF